MLNLEYHKGQPCVFKPLLCQEGFCSECIICIEQSSSITPSIIEENKQFVFKSKVFNKQPLIAKDVKSCV
jgi:hypothetical protein